MEILDIFSVGKQKFHMIGELFLLAPWASGPAVLPPVCRAPWWCGISRYGSDARDAFLVKSKGVRMLPWRSWCTDTVSLRFKVPQSCVRLSQDLNQSGAQSPRGSRDLSATVARSLKETLGWGFIEDGEDVGRRARARVSGP